MAIVFPDHINKNLDNLTGIGLEFKEYVEQHCIVRVLLGGHHGKIIPDSVGYALIMQK